MDVTASVPDQNGGKTVGRYHPVVLKLELLSQGLKISSAAGKADKPTEGLSIHGRMEPKPSSTRFDGKRRMELFSKITHCLLRQHVQPFPF